MKTYAGIGTRQLNPKDIYDIQHIAAKLSEEGCVVYSGNASGADISFQVGSKNQCVVMLPSKGFNYENYNPLDALDYVIVSDNDIEAVSSVDKFHPSPSRLAPYGRRLMARNYRQVHGYPLLGHPKVDFVVCCADVLSDGNVKGGTGQAVRIARSEGIPVFNIRQYNEWEDCFKDCKGILT